MNLYNEKIKFMHFRRYIGGTPSCKDGITVAYYQEGDRYTFAFTRCGKTNNFDRKEGRSWSVGRLKEREYKNVLAFGTAVLFRQFVEDSVASRFKGRFQRQYGKRKGNRKVVQLPSRMERNTEMNNTTINCS